MSQRSPFRYFRTNSDIIRLAVIMYMRFSLSLRNVEDLLHERGIDIRGGSVSLNRIRAFRKWFSAWVMPPPLLAPAG